MCVCVRVCLCAYRPEMNTNHLPHSPSTLVFETNSLIEPRADQFCETDGQQTLQQAVCTSPVLRMQE